MSKEFDVSKYLQSQQKTLPTIEYKEESVVEMPKPFKKALGIEGFALGHISMIYGFSDSGKTSFLLSAVKSCQDQDILPILIITENKLTRDRIVQAGVDLTKVILVEDLKYLEQVYNYISEKAQEVIDGKLPMKTMIFWDSVTGSPSEESFSVDKNGTIEKHFDNRKNANVIGFYSNIVASRIAETRRKEYDGILGLVMVNQAYVGEKPKWPAGAPAPIIAAGGEKVWFATSVAVEVKEGQRLKTKVKDTYFDYGLVSKVVLKKNHLSSVSCAGEVVFMGQDVYENDPKIQKEYIENHKEEWEKLLND